MLTHPGVIKAHPSSPTLAAHWCGQVVCIVIVVIHTHGGNKVTGPITSAKDVHKTEKLVLSLSLALGLMLSSVGLASQLRSCS